MSEKTFVNLDNDESMDVWNIREVASKLLPEANAMYNVYALARDLDKWHESGDVETPRPAIKFKNTSYWAATEETVDAWAMVLTRKQLEAEAKSWTKAEIVDKLFDFFAKQIRPMSQTKIANRDAYNRAEAVFDFVMFLDNYGIPDQDKKKKLLARIEQLRIQGGLK